MDVPVPENESHDTRLRRLRMRSWRRGMKEMDLILGQFADTELKNLSAEDLDDHEMLMNEPDQDLYAWLSGASPTPEIYKPAIARILDNMSTLSTKVS
ncbi:succinate dehydrogenase assembly factor 2 [Amylibacter sp. IMCC11727]|uniref:succinate dehydrogenase assembly factor 2 n=1 Tax=Amylibacter sp. IMCC11727 TaxID=3039851 RepID=UPI00244E1FA9|nr:succinate dehydrogenase assembly factor 2 [Amylibacter sp. IMCC11727]WGI20774.1 succinate dehydrogenase assembly factor 2 [Amylibacter sp. IMCC11727]